nr:ABC transporter permease [Bacteroidota bacterium]
MNQSELKFTFRSLWKNKIYAATSMLSFAVALSCAMLIFLFITEELSFDNFHEKGDRIYRLESDFTISGRNQKVAKSPFAFGRAFVREFPEVEQFTRFRSLDHAVFKYGDKSFFEEAIFYADSTTFDIFSFPVISGNPQTMLKEPNSIVLTRKLANKYFDDQDPMGKVISVQNGLRCKVTGIIEDVPQNSHIRFDGLISFVSMANVIGDRMYKSLDQQQFWAIRLYTYILLSEKGNIENVHKKFPEFYEKNMSEFGKQINGTFSLLTHRIDKVYLNTNLDWDFQTGNKKLLWIFVIIAMAVLLLASINYMNLATIQSEKKAKAIGIRKVFGAHSMHLTRLNMTESLALTLVAFFIAIVLCHFLIKSHSANFRSILVKTIFYISECWA